MGLALTSYTRIAAHDNPQTITTPFFLKPAPICWEPTASLERCKYISNTLFQIELKK